MKILFLKNEEVFTLELALLQSIHLAKQKLFNEEVSDQYREFLLNEIKQNEKVIKKVEKGYISKFFGKK